MFKLIERAIEALLIGAMTTAIVQAQTISQTTAIPTPSVTLPVAPETATVQAPDVQETPQPAPQTTPPRSQMAWHNGRGAEYFIAGDYLFSPNDTNEFNRYGTNGNDTFAGRVGVEYPVGKLAVMMEGTFDHYQYSHLAGPVPIIGPKRGETIVPAFYAHNVDWDGRVGIGLQYPRVFLVGSYAQRLNNYGYPTLQGFGFGVEKLPDFNHRYWSFFGSYLYYPQFGSGSYLQYGLYKYQAGLEFHLNAKRVPTFLEVGYLGDYGYAGRNAPTYISDRGVFAGLGFHF